MSAIRAWLSDVRLWIIGCQMVAIGFWLLGDYLLLYVKK
jgi:hypothetical protein